ncbi:hypothetical protein T265_01403 [Opisthorchis viverrini]|uniref:Uncharacterized protein n=1 Tax=Opisthorchis viverrini TaxID=6198 RepID=A0A074ZZL4_OPIVI|nr:hypothetical protein T265_01403 [Opisthorchis viverrini]KER32526.1 hypothetical protein T265_01403 [Opisthorchis viverrini]
MLVNLAKPDQFVRPTNRVREWSRTASPSNGDYCVKRRERHLGSEPHKQRTLSVDWIPPSDSKQNRLSNGIFCESLSHPKSSRLISHSCTDIPVLWKGRCLSSKQFADKSELYGSSQPESQSSASCSIGADHDRPVTKQRLPRIVNAVQNLDNLQHNTIPVCVETESLRQFYESRFTRVLVSPVPVSLYTKQTESGLGVSTDHAEWICVKLGLLTYLICHDPVKPSAVKAVDVQLCDPFTYASIWIGTIDLSRFPDRKPLTHQTAPNFGQHAATLYDVTQFHSQMVEHTFVCKVVRERTLMHIRKNKVWMKNKYLSSDLTDYQVHKLRFQISRNQIATKRLVDNLGSKVQQCLAKAMRRKANLQEQNILLACLPISSITVTPVRANVTLKALFRTSKLDTERECLAPLTPRSELPGRNTLVPRAHLMDPEATDQSSRLYPDQSDLGLEVERLPRQ